MLTLNVLILILAIAPSLISAEEPLFPSYPEMQMLNEQSFDSEVIQKTETSRVVAFVEPNCSGCKAMGNDYGGMARKLSLSNRFKLYAVDCTRNKQLCDKQGIVTFPTIKSFPIAVPAVYTSTDLSEDAMLEWIMAQAPNHIEMLRSKKQEIRRWVLDHETGHRAILFTAAGDKEVPLYWKLIAGKYYERLRLAVVHDNLGDIRAKLTLPRDVNVVIYKARSVFNPREVTLTAPVNTATPTIHSLYYYQLIKAIDMFFAVTVKR